ncbi:MAG TPA: hypothetical protein DCE71_03720 [Parachlamydiales bacterium]|nr:hypothetical protein [Parachlamydiales bacterium]
MSLEQKVTDLEKRQAAQEKKQAKDHVALVVFSEELDRAMAAFIIATGAAAVGQKVTMFFTFWGLNILRKQKIYAGKDWMSRMMTLMAPSGASHLSLSHMNFWGIGTKMMMMKMKEKKVATLQDLIQTAQDLGVNLIACEMTRDLMNIKDEELINQVGSGGVGSFLGEALQSRLTLFF